MPLHYLPGFHSGIANLCKRLRYLLGGIRPRQTTHQILSQRLLQGCRLELKIYKGGISLLIPVNRNLPPILNMHTPNPISSYSKASRGLFVQLWLTSIFTRLAISPSPSLRQCPSCYAIRAGRNLPDKEFRYLRTIIVIAGVHPRLSSELLPSKLRITPPLNVRTLARRHPLYILLRVSRELCFW